MVKPRDYLTRNQQRVTRQRRMQVTGLALLAAGYALLAVSPDTPFDWVLLRVAAGFGLLFIGFATAIMPWLARISGGDEE